MNNLETGVYYYIEIYLLKFFSGIMSKYVHSHNKSSVMSDYKYLIYVYLYTLINMILNNRFSSKLPFENKLTPPKNEMVTVEVTVRPDGDPSLKVTAVNKSGLKEMIIPLLFF